jgi:hypothetical protein
LVGWKGIPVGAGVRRRLVLGAIGLGTRRYRVSASLGVSVRVETIPFSIARLSGYG